MNRIIRDPFTSRFPYIDLHGEEVSMIKVIIETFIKDNCTLKKEKIVIIHGKGTGALKKATHEILKNNLYVESFYQDAWNEGQTIVRLKK